MSLNRVVVLGLGKVGSLVGTLLSESGFKVTGLDAVAQSGLPFDAEVLNLADAAAVRPFLRTADAVVSCLPFHLNSAVAREAHAAGIHYFDLTEDVATTDEIRELAKTSRGVMAPQCGLAPGFIGIVGADLARKFDRLRSIELKVGALPKHPRGKLGYAMNWSPEGVINEYINDCEVIRFGRRQMVPALEGYEVVVIDGVQLEAATTSGGLGTMCETYDGRVETLHYKSMRYLGHFEHIRFLFQELRMQEDRALLGRVMRNALPTVAEDFVFVHAAVEGFQGGQLVREEFVRSYSQTQVAGHEWRAISWTTATSLCAVIELVRDDILPQHGFVKQESIPFDAFLKTKNGAHYLRQDRG
jgi:saccharopine dehydrogenase (NAD+, L-lysine-forming)